jgi:hypothetical protein
MTRGFPFMRRSPLNLCNNHGPFCAARLGRFPDKFR